MVSLKQQKIMNYSKGMYNITFIIYLIKFTKFHSMTFDQMPVLTFETQWITVVATTIQVIKIFQVLFKNSNLLINR